MNRRPSTLVLLAPLALAALATLTGGCALQPGDGASPEATASTAEAIASGQLDPNFEGGGVPRTAIGGTHLEARALVQLSDGRFGEVGDRDGQIAISWHHDDGSVATELGDNGYTFMSVGVEAYVDAAVVLSDDSVVIGGSVCTVSQGAGWCPSNHALLAKVKGGVPDPYFAPKGYRVFDLVTDGGQVSALLADGKAFLAFGGGDGTGVPVLTHERWLPDGTIDTTYAGGSVSTESPGEQIVLGAVRQIDGSVIVAGRLNDGNPTPFARRYLANGTADLSFGNHGNGLWYAPSTVPGEGRAVTVDGSGRILVAGWEGQTILVRRLTAGGLPDTSFGVSGVVRTDFASFGLEAATSVAVDPWGRIYVGGFGTTTSGDLYWGEEVPYQILAARYTSQGALDPTFDGDGKVITTVPYEVTSGAFAGMVDPVTRRFTVFGRAGGDFVMVRYTN